mgnify:CR=1 FL=1
MLFATYNDEFMVFCMLKVVDYMNKTQMYFPINPVIKRRVEATARQLSIPASNIISEIVTQAFSRDNLKINVAIPKARPSTDNEIKQDDEMFANGNHGKKHHVID